MSKCRKQIGAVLSGILLGFLVSQKALAQQPSVELRLDTGAMEVGEALDGQIVCTNTDPPESPRFAAPAGLDVRLTNATPFTSSMTSIVNGRRSQQTTYTFPIRVTALKEGTHTLGPIEVSAGGATYKSLPVTVVVKKQEINSQPKSDRLIYVEMSAEPKSLYVTQSYTATLVIGIRKVVIDGATIEMDILRSVLDLNSSELSVFARGRAVRSELWLTDSAGQRHRYEILKVTQELRAETVGGTTVGPVFLRANYPTSVRRSFFGGYEVSRASKETARAPAISIEVKPPPAAGRPEDFSGAIGWYTMDVTIKPARVPQGQPVTLSVAIKGSPIEGIAGPNLSVIPELVSRFDFTTDELTGDLEQGAKVFRRAIFPKQQGEQTVPPITWSYFDPQAERYVTLASPAIPITVDPPVAGSTTIALSDEGSSDEGLTLTVLEGGILPNYVDAKMVLATHSELLGFPALALLILPPLGFFMATLTVRHRERLRTDVNYARRRRAARMASKSIARAARCAHAVGWNILGHALATYLQDRFDLSPGRRTPAEVREILRQRGVAQPLSDDVGSFLESCEAARYAPGTSVSSSLDEGAEQVRNWIVKLERSPR